MSANVYSATIKVSMINIKKALKNRVVIILAVLSLAAIIAIPVWRNASDSSRDANETAPTNTVDYEPPSESEQSAGDKQKETNIKKDEAIKESPDTSQTANVVIVDASQYGDTVEVRAFVSNIYEDAGTCQLTFTQGSTTVTHSKTAFKDATTTQCGTFEVPRSEFPAGGEWNVQVTYNSNATSGQATQKITLR